VWRQFSPSLLCTTYVYLNLRLTSQGILPPTINLEEHDEDGRENWDCDYIPNVAKQVDLQSEGKSVALTNSFGFGGVNASLAFGRFIDHS